MANKRLKVGDVVRWKEQHRERWPDYPEPLIVVQSDLRAEPSSRNDFVVVTDANGITRKYTTTIPFSPDWFELDLFLTAVHQRRKHGK